MLKIIIILTLIFSIFYCPGQNKNIRYPYYVLIIFEGLCIIFMAILKTATITRTDELSLKTCIATITTSKRFFKEHNHMNLKFP